MVQLQMLNKILKDKDSSLLLLNNLSADYFSDYPNEYNFIKSHLISNWSCIIAAMLLFCGFKELPEKFNAVINKFGGATFGVYLIHGQLIFYPFVLQKIFKIGERLNSGYIIPWTIFTLIVVYIVFSLVEMLRKETIERFAMKICFIIENKVKLLYKNES